MRLLAPLLVLAVVISIGWYLLRAHPAHEAAVGPADRIEPAHLTNGENIQWLGTYVAEPDANGMRSYASTTLGVSMSYPETYLLFTREDDAWTNAFASLVLAPATSTLLAIARADAGYASEGPGAISIQFFDAPGMPFTLEGWLRMHSNFSNFDPANDSAIRLASTTVAGIPALSYRTTLGLFPFDYRVFASGARIVLVSAPADYEPDLTFVLEHLEFSRSR